MTEQEFKNADAYFVQSKTTQHYVHNNGESFFYLNSNIDAHVFQRAQAIDYIKHNYTNGDYKAIHISEALPCDINVKNLQFTNTLTT
jgi:hypothetical protein